MNTHDEEFLVFGQPEFGQEEIDQVLDSISKSWLGTGPKVAQFERNFAKYKNASNSAAVYSATAGLHLGCLSLDLKPGDEIITTPLTFCATINAIIHAGGIPVLADVDPVTMNIDPREIEKKITSKTRAILPVHFAGRMCDMDAIMAIAQKHNLIVIEDCAHAIESEYRGKKSGMIGDMGVFSFYATKNLATGEGGMVLTKDPEKLKKIKVPALHGMDADAWKRFSDEGYKHYEVVAAGFKYNMMDIQACFGIPQLKKLESNWLRRKAIWEFYMQELKNLPISIPAPIQSYERHGFHLFIALIDEAKTGIDRDDFLHEMGKRKLGVGVHYRSIPEFTYYQQRFGWKPEHYPNAMYIGRTTVSLPFSVKLTSNDTKRVVRSIKDILKHGL